MLQCGKSDKIFITLKKRHVWVFLDRGERGDDNETSMKEGGGIEMSTTVLSIYAMHALFRLNYLLLDVGADGGALLDCNFNCFSCISIAFNFFSASSLFSFCFFSFFSAC